MKGECTCEMTQTCMTKLINILYWERGSPQGRVKAKRMGVDYVTTSKENWYYKAEGIAFAERAHNYPIKYTIPMVTISHDQQ